MKQPTSQISRHDTTVNNHIRDGIERIVKNEFFGADLRGADDRYRATHRSTIQQDIRGWFASFLGDKIDHDFMSSHKVLRGSRALAKSKSCGERNMPDRAMMRPMSLRVMTLAKDMPDIWKDRCKDGQTDKTTLKQTKESLIWYVTSPRLKSAKNFDIKEA